MLRFELTFQNAIFLQRGLIDDRVTGQSCCGRMQYSRGRLAQFDAWRRLSVPRLPCDRQTD